MAIYFPSFCWGQHTSTNKNKTVTLELGACSDMENPPVDHFPWQVMGSTWLFHCFSMVFVGKSTQLFSWVFAIAISKVRHIQATIGAFAAILKNGRVVTWGHPCCGGDISSFQDTLRNVQDSHGAMGGFNGKPVGREPRVELRGSQAHSW